MYLIQQDDYKTEREEMVLNQISFRGVTNSAVVEAMKKVPRHLFVPENLQYLAYTDAPLPLGYGQTISQPYMVAFMTEAAHLTPAAKVLEIGTGCGYQAAILSQICKKVYTIEIVKPLAEEAKRILKDLGYLNIHVRQGDGWEGWPQKAPFDAIIMTAAPKHLPQPILSQLKMGGILIIPLGEMPNQALLRYTKIEEGLKEEALMPVRFVPMTGKAQQME
ncbi:MAG: protein-L-isoaspartate(D-aspartate) O-methyltransferase [Alphaproteobacteria bacterium]|nr:protein-L-isoaspartate(D-aspartate) O-methyltransferase [Alphaproteobacteria bacterium]